MLEATESLLPKITSQRLLRALCAGTDPVSLDEMQKLLETLDMDIPKRMDLKLRTINPGTFIGRGKLEEIENHLKAENADLFVVDEELSPNQLKNLEKRLSIPVLDRPGVIIEIFSRHARTKEAKTQIELARLTYLLPRLVHFWTHFERQRGGIGMKGMGEAQIEVDRRLVKDRIKILRDRLKSIEKERGIRRSGRKDVLKVAIVGYTNAGKSTLLNALTGSEVVVEDKLFATLDPSVRLLDPDSKPPVVMIDTVGFVGRLPTFLIASFRSTLEEMQEADLILHVVDSSSAHAKKEMEVTEALLKELEVDQKPRITVLNKIDLLKGQGKKNLSRLLSPGARVISALNSDDVSQLRQDILARFHQAMKIMEMLIPYSESRVEALLHAHARIEVKRYLEKGTFYRIRIHEGWAQKLKLGRFCT